MKQIKLSLVEKKTIRMLLLFLLLQLTIIFSLISTLRGNWHIDINETKQANIIVDDIYCYRLSREDQLFVIADSKKYLFTGRDTLKEYSVNDLYNSISKGDSLSLLYYEAENIIFGKFNVVVDARSETEIYRTLEEYNRARKGAPIFVILLYSVIELIFVGVVLLYCWGNQKITKGLYRKIKKRYKTQR